MTAPSVLSVTEVQVPGRRSPTQVFRGGEGRPLVYLHGGTAVTATDPFALALARRHEVVAPVHPGFRDLEEIDDLRDVHDLALYHDDLLRALGLGPVAVVGHSFGGMVAAELAAHVPDRVARLVLAAPFGLWRDEEPVADLFAAFPADVAPLLWADPSSEAAQAAMASMLATIPVPGSPGTEAGSPAASGDGGSAGAGFAQGGPRTATADASVLVRLLVEMVPAMATIGKYLWPIPDKGLERRLHRVSAPTLLLWGAEDRLVPPSYAEAFAARLPSARVEILDKAGHMLVLERLEDVARLVEEFVAA
jgi:pimeloyl-ACP methyl ester carboxylesterase